MSMIINIKNPVPEYALSAIKTQNGDEGRLDSSLLSTHDDIDADLDFSDQDDERMVAEFDDFIDMDYSQEISKTGY